MALILAVTTTVMGLVSFAHAQEECPYGQYRAASGDCVPRPNKNRAEPQLSVKMGHFLIRSIRTPVVRALAMEECANT